MARSEPCTGPSPEPPAPAARSVEVSGAAADWRILLVAALFGIAMGAVALAFIRPIQWAEAAAEAGLRAGPRLFVVGVVLLPALGGLACATVVALLPLDLRGGGVAAVMYAVARGRSRLPLRFALRQWLASSATIVSGGSAGPEGPIVTIGAALGSSLARALRLDREGTTTLLGAGAAGGIAAVFNAPIAAVFFTLEVLLRDFSMRTIAPIVVASVLSSAATQTLLGTREPLFGVNPSLFDPLRERLTVWGAPAFVLLGIACAIVSVVFVRTLRSMERFFEHSRIPRFFRPALGGLLLGVLGAAYVLTSTSAHDGSMPAFMGNGYSLVDRLLVPQFYATARADGTLGALGVVLLLWLALKMLGTALTLGSGGSGGLFAPSLLLGALVGGAFGILVESTGLVTSATPAHFALVGMAGTVAATTHAPLTGMILVYELTGDYSMILPLMLTATLATLGARSIERESAYTAELAVHGVRLGTLGDQSILRRLTVHDVTLVPAVTVRPDETADRLVHLSDRCAVGEFVVVNEHGTYVGLLGGRELRSALVHREALPLLQVGEISRAGVPALTAGDPLDVALDRFDEGQFAALPVIDSAGRIEGLLTRENLMRRYNVEMERDA